MIEYGYATTFTIYFEDGSTDKVYASMKKKSKNQSNHGSSHCIMVIAWSLKLSMKNT